jgi:hypothetical protein
MRHPSNGATPATNGPAGLGQGEADRAAKPAYLLGKLAQPLTRADACGSYGLSLPKLRQENDPKKAPFKPSAENVIVHQIQKAGGTANWTMEWATDDFRQKLPLIELFV